MKTTLSPRALNRALLDRQGPLRRTRRSASDPRGVVDEIEAEGAGLVELLAPDADERRVALSAR